MAEAHKAVTASDTPRTLPPLLTGTQVRIQNQVTNWHDNRSPSSSPVYN